MPITSQEDFLRAKGLLDNGKAKDPTRLQSAIAQYQQHQDDQARGYLRKPEAAPGDVIGTGSVSKPNAQGYDIDLSRPDAMVLQPGETEGSKRLQGLRKQFEDRSLPNATKLKVFNDPAEYEPKQPPKLSPFNPMSPFSSGQPVAADGGTQKRYFHEPTIAEFRNDVAKSPELQARLSKDFPHISDKLKSKVDDNNIEFSDTFKAYQDARWKMAYADAVKKGLPLYRLAYTKAIPDSEKSLIKASDMGNAAVSGAGQGATLGLLDPIKAAINPKLTEEDRAQRQRNPGSAFAGDVVGSAVGGPRLLFGGLAKLAPVKKLGEVSKYLPGIAAGAGTGAIDDSARQVGESVAESLDAHDAALEALARIRDRFDPVRTVMAAGIGGVSAGVGEGIADTAHGWGRKIVSHPERLPVINRNINSGGEMGYGGGIKLEPEIQAAESLAGRVGGDAEDVMAAKLAKNVTQSQRLAQEGLARETEAETAAAHAAMKNPEIKNGSMSMGPDQRPTGPTASKIRAMADQFSGGTPEAKATMRRIQNFADFVEKQGSVDVHGLDRLEADADLWAKNNGSRPNDIGQKVAGIVRDLRDEFDIPAGDATIVDRPQFAVRDAKGTEKLVGKYSGMNADQANRMHKLEFENKTLGLPERIPVKPRRTETVKLDVIDEPHKGVFDKLHGTTPETYNGTPGQVEALMEGPPNVDLEPNVQKGVADNIKRGAHLADTDPTREAIIHAGERSGPDFRRGLDLIRSVGDRKAYRNMLGKAINGMGGVRFNTNQLLRVVPTLKGIAGGRPTPPSVEPTELLEKAIDELFSGKKANPDNVLGQELKRSGDEVMDKFVPELGGGLFNIGGSRLPSGAASVTKKRKGEESVLQQLTPQEQKLLVDIIGNLSKMTPEAP